MLDGQIIDKIEQFVFKSPRTIQEISELLGKNWRTADKYVAKIVENYGTIGVKVFRGGTKGALKIVYWAGVENASNTVFQEELETEIMQGREKYDFYPFDMYQFVNDKKKNISVNEKSDNRIKVLVDYILSAKKTNPLFFWEFILYSTSV